MKKRAFVPAEAKHGRSRVKIILVGVLNQPAKKGSLNRNAGGETGPGRPMVHK